MGYGDILGNDTRDIIPKEAIKLDNIINHHNYKNVVNIGNK